MILIYILGAILAIFALTVMFGAPYVPTHRKDLEKLFAEIKPSPKDILVDIGSGDGVVLKTASQFGAKSIGFEINPILVAISNFRLRKFQNANVKFANFWRAFPIEKATIIYTFGHSERIQKMYDLAQKQANSQKSALKFVSYGFQVPNITPMKQIGAHFIYEIRPKNLENYKHSC